MRPFEYTRPETLDEVFTLLNRYGSDARLLAGGTDVMVRLRMGRTPPRIVIDLKGVAALRPDIVEFESFLRVGARAVMSDLIGDERVKRRFPALVEAASVVGSVQIRNRATLAGNICNASPAADTAPALLVHQAIVNVVGAEGCRSVPVADFFTGPGKTVLKQGEIVESIDLPRETNSCGTAFGRITRRWGVDLATINLACLVTNTGETRFAFGAVGPRPFLVRDDGRSQDRETMLQRLIANASPISDVRGSRKYREAMLLVMSRRCLESAMSRMQ